MGKITVDGFAFDMPSDTDAFMKDLYEQTPDVPGWPKEGSDD